MNRLLKTTGLWVLVLVLFAGCDSEGSGADDEQHPAVAQFVLEADGEALVTAANGTVTGELTMFTNQETDLIQIKLLRADGTEIEVSEANELTLRENLANTSIVTWLRQEDPMTFKLRAKGLGQTILSFDLFHQDHRDYESPDITVRVIDTP
ncbi:MAG: hypothetical protein RhofKO_20520 [Rhodothermales bacterium]